MSSHRCTFRPLHRNANPLLGNVGALQLAGRGRGAGHAGLRLLATSTIPTWRTAFSRTPHTVRSKDPRAVATRSPLSALPWGHPHHYEGVLGRRQQTRADGPRE